MIRVYLDTSGDLTQASQQLGLPVGQLLTPLTRFRNRYPEDFAIDNGAFSGLDVGSFRSLLKREEGNKAGCRFVVAPDVPFSMRRTLELLGRWRRDLAGWPTALAIQNDVDFFDLPWEMIDAVFIGGDDSFKTSRHSLAVIRAAKALGKWVHVGRVNTPGRFRWCVEAGVDSIDGTGISHYTHMRAVLRGPDQMELKACEMPAEEREKLGGEVPE